MVLNDPPGQMTFGQVARHRFPGAAAVGDCEPDTERSPRLVVVQHRVDRIHIVQVGFDVVDKSTFGNAVDLVDLPPMFAAVFGDLNQPVIGPDIDQSLLQRRFADRRDVSILAHRIQIPHRVDTPHASHVRQREAVYASRQIGADRLPRVAPVIAAVQFLRAEVDAACDCEG